MLEKLKAMWAKITGACFHSLTVAWTYLLGIAGFALEAAGQIGDAIGDPALKQQITDALGGDTTKAARVLMAIAVITFIARMRSLRKSTGG